MRRRPLEFEGRLEAKETGAAADVGGVPVGTCPENGPCILTSTPTEEKDVENFYLVLLPFSAVFSA